MTDRLGFSSVEDRTLPAVVYGLYLLAFATGVTALIGLIVAYVQRRSAAPRMATHYTFLVRTFWLSIFWWLTGAALVLVGGVLSVILVGIPFFALGMMVLGLVGVWWALRCVVGVIYLARDEAYPRPYALLV